MGEILKDSKSAAVTSAVGIVAFMYLEESTFALVAGAVFIVSIIVMSMAKSSRRHNSAYKFHKKSINEAKHEIDDEEKEKKSEKGVAQKEIEEYSNEKREYKDAQEIHAYMNDEKKLTYNYGKLKDPKILEKVILEAQQVINRFKDMREKLMDDYRAERECYQEEIKDIAKLKRESNTEKDQRADFNSVETKEDIREIRKRLKLHKEAIDDEIRLEKLIRIDEHIIKDCLHLLMDAHILVDHQIKLIRKFDHIPSGEFYAKLEKIIKQVDNKDNRVARLIVRREKITKEMVVELKKIRDDLNNIEQEDTTVIKLNTQEDKEDKKIEQEVRNIAA